MKETVRTSLIVQRKEAKAKASGIWKVLVPVAIAVFALTSSISPDTTSSTPQDTNAPVVMLAGDIVCDTSNRKTVTCTDKETAELIMDIQPDAVIALGDLCHDETDSACMSTRYDVTWGQFAEHTFPVRGNHDMPQIEAYKQYWKGKNPALSNEDIERGYYSFNMGDWHIIALDNAECKDASGCETDTPQYKWFTQDLEQNKDKACTMVVAHKPLFSSGTQATRSVKKYFDVAYQHDVDIFFAGHEHDLEGFRPQDPDGNLDWDRGIWEFVVGTGGASSIRMDKPQPNSFMRSTNGAGVMQLTLNSGSLDYAFIPIDKTIFFNTKGTSGTIPCH